MRVARILTLLFLTGCLLARAVPVLGGRKKDRMLSVGRPAVSRLVRLIPGHRNDPEKLEADMTAGLFQTLAPLPETDAVVADPDDKDAPSPAAMDEPDDEESLPKVHSVNTKLQRDIKLDASSLSPASSSHTTASTTASDPGASTSLPPSQTPVDQGNSQSKTSTPVTEPIMAKSTWRLLIEQPTELVAYLDRVVESPRPITGKRSFELVPYQHASRLAALPAVPGPITVLAYDADQAAASRQPSPALVLSPFSSYAGLRFASVWRGPRTPMQDPVPAIEARYRHRHEPSLGYACSGFTVDVLPEVRYPAAVPHLIEHFQYHMIRSHRKNNVRPWTPLLELYGDGDEGVGPANAAVANPTQSASRAGRRRGHASAPKADPQTSNAHDDQTSIFYFEQFTGTLHDQLPFLRPGALTSDPILDGAILRNSIHMFMLDMATAVSYLHDHLILHGNLNPYNFVFVPCATAPPSTVPGGYATPRRPSVVSPRRPSVVSPRRPASIVSPRYLTRSRSHSTPLSPRSAAAAAYTPPAFTLKVRDLGCSSKLNSASLWSAAFAGLGSAAKRLLGDPRYMAPEILTAASQHTLRSDIWSLGILFMELIITMRLPRLAFPSIWRMSGPRDTAFPGRLAWDPALTNVLREPNNRAAVDAHVAYVHGWIDMLHEEGLLGHSFEKTMLMRMLSSDPDKRPSSAELCGILLDMLTLRPTLKSQLL